MRFLEIAASRKRDLNWDAVRDVADPANGVEKYDLDVRIPRQGCA